MVIEAPRPIFDRILRPSLFRPLARKVAAIEIAGTPKRRCNNTLRGLESLPVTLTPSLTDSAMPVITFIHQDGNEQRVEAGIGESAMLAATRHDVNGIVAECGGNAMCATCHVYVDEAWLPRLPAMSSDEDALLDGAAAERRPNSRLSCQIKLATDLDGLVLQLPDRQI